ncbi:hypothetical protein O97_00058, partial [Bartonella henselae str. Zeus]
FVQASGDPQQPMEKVDPWEPI